MECKPLAGFLGRGEQKLRHSTLVFHLLYQRPNLGGNKFQGRSSFLQKHMSNL